MSIVLGVMGNTCSFRRGYVLKAVERLGRNVKRYF